MIEVRGYNECLSGTGFGYSILAIGEIAFYLQNRQCLSKQRQTVLRRRARWTDIWQGLHKQYRINLLL